jgi:integrase
MLAVDRECESSSIRRLQRALLRVGLVDATGKPLAHLHDARRTSGSIALARGVALPTVSRVLGHSRVDVTARHYAQLLSERELAAYAEAHDGFGTLGAMSTGVAPGVAQGNDERMIPPG